MYQNVEQQVAGDWQQLQAINYEERQPYQSDAEQESGQEVNVKKKKATLYDRLEIQWLVLAEIGFTLLTFIGTIAFITFLRVFGAGLLAGSVGLVAVMSAIIVLVCFWRELNASEFKLRVFLCLIALGCSLALSMSDQAVDLTRHYWALLQASLIVGGVTTIAAGALVMGIKQGNSSAID